MQEALCRPSGTTLDIVHAEDGPPITQRTSGLGWTLIGRFLPAIVLLMLPAPNLLKEEPAVIIIRIAVATVLTLLAISFLGFAG